MYENIKTSLKQLRNVRPDGDFVYHTRAQVLAGRGPRVVSPFLTAAGGVAFAAFAMLLVTLLFNPTPPTVSALDTGALENEFQGLKLDLQLQKLDYNQEVHDTITTALVEIEGETNHLNEQLIESENDLIGTLTASSSEQIDTLLNRVLE